MWLLLSVVYQIFVLLQIIYSPFSWLVNVFLFFFSSLWFHNNVFGCVFTFIYAALESLDTYIQSKDLCLLSFLKDFQLLSPCILPLSILFFCNSYQPCLRIPYFIYYVSSSFFYIFYLYNIQLQCQQTHIFQFTDSLGYFKSVL